MGKRKQVLTKSLSGRFSWHFIALARPEWQERRRSRYHRYQQAARRTFPTGSKVW
jgi:hypothetical protein